MQWLLKEHRDWIDAEYCINTDAGDFEMQKGKKVLMGVETSEKNYVDFALEVKSAGGHSSRPIKDNAIYNWPRDWKSCHNLIFRCELNETTRSFFAQTAQASGTQSGRRLYCRGPDATRSRGGNSTFAIALL